MNAIASGCWDGTFRSSIFFPSMFPALGLHLFYKKRSNIYKDKDEVWGMDVPPNTMESDSATTLVQDSSAIFADDGDVGRGSPLDRYAHERRTGDTNEKLHDITTITS